MQHPRVIRWKGETECRQGFGGAKQDEHSRSSEWVSVCSKRVRCRQPLLSHPSGSCRRSFRVILLYRVNTPIPTKYSLESRVATLVRAPRLLEAPRAETKSLRTRRLSKLVRKKSSFHDCSHKEMCRRSGTHRRKTAAFVEPAHVVPLGTVLTLVKPTYLHQPIVVRQCPSCHCDSLFPFLCGDDCQHICTASTRTHRGV